jgi:hypothetical protein
MTESIDSIICDQCGELADFSDEGGNRPGYGGICSECGDTLCFKCAKQWPNLADVNEPHFNVCISCLTKIEADPSHECYNAVRDFYALLNCIETSSTALDELRGAGFTGQCKQAVADVLRSGIVPVPNAFPGSYGCIQYGRAIARYILENRQCRRDNGSNSVVGTKKKGGVKT